MNLVTPPPSVLAQPVLSFDIHTRIHTPPRPPPPARVGQRTGRSGLSSQMYEPAGVTVMPNRSRPGSPQRTHRK
jgi:hypothetical protein